MINCVRCGTPTAPEDMAPGRRHCRKCQRRASRISYYRNRFTRLEQINRRRAERYGCQIAGDVCYAEIYAREIGQPCWRCSETVTPDNYEFDHAFPLASGGAHSTQNIHLVHRYCNRSASMRQFILSSVLRRRA